VSKAIRLRAAQALRALGQRLRVDSLAVLCDK
jgi:hypothetical protein